MRVGAAAAGEEREGVGGRKRGWARVGPPDAAGAGRCAKSGMAGMQPALAMHGADGAGDSEVKISSCAACRTALALRSSRHFGSGAPRNLMLACM